MIEGQAATEQAEGEYARVELMGHRTRVGRIEEVERFGTRLLRVDFYDADTDSQATEMYGGASIYCVSLVSKAVVDAWEKNQWAYSRPSVWQLPAPDPQDPFAEADEEVGPLDGRDE